MQTWQTATGGTDDTAAGALLAGTAVVAGGALIIGWRGHVDTLEVIDVTCMEATTTPCAHHASVAVIDHRTRVLFANSSLPAAVPSRRAMTGPDLERRLVEALPGWAAQAAIVACTVCADVDSRVERPVGIILVGPSGVGKTHFLQQLVRVWPFPHRTVIASDVFQQAQPLVYLREHVFSLRSAGRALLILEDIDALVSLSQGSNSGLERRLLAECCKLLDHLQRTCLSHGLTLIGTTSRLGSIHASVLRAGRMGTQVFFPVPSKQQRQDILRQLFAALALRLDPSCCTLEEVQALAMATPGYLPADLERLCQQAVLHAVRRQAEAGTAANNTVGMLDFTQARSIVRPSLLAAVPTAAAAWRRQVALEDLVGMDEIIAQVQTCLALPLQRPELYRQAGFGRPGGLLLYGPAGVGKTCLALAVAHVSSNNCIVVDATAVRSKVVGQSETALRRLFQLALDSQPCVLLIDQLETLAPRHLPSSDPSSVRLLTSLLAELDRAHAADIVVLATTQDPQSIDPRLLSGNRFDQQIHIPLPSPTARQALFRYYLAGMPVSEPRATLITALVARTEGYSAADIQHICQEAALSALRADLVAAREVAHEYFLAAVNTHHHTKKWGHNRQL